MTALVLWGAVDTARSAPAPKSAPPRAATSKDAVAGSAVLASFKGGQITVADLQAAIANKDPGTRARLAAADERLAFLRELERYDLLALEAERRGYATHPLVIEAGKRAAIDAMVARDLQVDPASIPAAEVASHFDSKREDYARPVLRRASHIAFATREEASASIAELKGATRERFAKLAVERSQDERTRRQGGELGYFDREGRAHVKGQPAAVAPELAEAAFALQREGQIAKQPVAHGALFSVLMYTGEMPAIEPRLSEMDGQLRAEIAEERFVRAQKDLLEQLQAQLKPVVNAELVAAIDLEPAQRSDQPHGFPAAPPDPRAAPKVVEPDGF